MTLNAAEIDAINQQASVLMKRGIGLMIESNPASLAQALACFDGALELRRKLPLENMPMLRYGLAACWLNRGEALMRASSDNAAIAQAVVAYEEGIQLLHGLALETDERFPRRLAIAYQNLGLALQVRDRESADQSVAALTNAIKVLERDYSAPISDRTYLLAAAWANLAHVRAQAGTAESDFLAREAALSAVAHVKNLEHDDVDAAHVGLTARHVLCRALVGSVSQMAESDGQISDEVHFATDTVDDGLSLVRHWEGKGVGRFRGIAQDLFRFGARLYAAYQPHFLKEFIVDNLDPGLSSPGYVESDEIRSVAMELIGEIAATDER